MFVRAFVLLATVAIGANATPYTYLRDMFALGSRFDFASKLGWHSGRCWMSEGRPVEGGLLVLEERAPNGPAFPIDQKFMVFSGAGKPVEPNRFDVLKPEDRAAVRQGLDNAWSLITTLEDESSIRVSYAQILYDLRLSQDAAFLVLKMASLNNPEAAGYCYFFKRVDG